LAQAGLVLAKWTNEILDEMLQALSRNGQISRRTGLTAFAS
jgi:hypothetical protein